MWIRRCIMVCTVMALAAMVYMTIFGDQGIKDLVDLRHRLEQTLAENDRIVEANKVLMDTADRLKNDPEFIEDMARHSLKLVREGDIVVEVVRPEGFGAKPAVKPVEEYPVKRP